MTFSFGLWLWAVRICKNRLVTLIIRRTCIDPVGQPFNLLGYQFGAAFGHFTFCCQGYKGTVGSITWNNNTPIFLNRP